MTRVKPEEVAMLFLSATFCVLLLKIASIKLGLSIPILNLPTPLTIISLITIYCMEAKK